ISKPWKRPKGNGQAAIIPVTPAEIGTPIDATTTRGHPVAVKELAWLGIPPWTKIGAGAG
ncbi:hypothetical protein, partial [Salmonella enterica]|uniref:hypothetical protein n=1 Tax=Salmonella enterica TaxID=28901 RepID=UPI000A487115